MHVSIRSRRMSAGESHVAACRQRRWLRFNPLPPNVGGRMQPQPRPNAAGTPFQSAPAECRRENHRRSLASCGRMRFQSAPADCRRENRRALHGADRHRSRFNPLPPNVGGRMRSPQRYARSRHVFQSAPAECRRENDGMPRSPARASRVSIRSRRMSAGECRPIAGSSPRAHVSIRSRRLSAGEYQLAIDSMSPCSVSIRSRRLSAGECCTPARRRWHVHVSIRSRRLSAGECRDADRPAALVSSFNPLPPTVGGRMLGWTRCDRPAAGFNPLPPNVGGRMAALSSQRCSRNVSIRSRRLSAGECDVWRRSSRRPMRFNPLPPTVGGRMRSPRVPSRRSLFQSAPADCRRENRPTCIADRTDAFQSAPADCRRENPVTRTPSGNGLCEQVFAYLCQKAPGVCHHVRNGSAKCAGIHTCGNRECSGVLAIALGPRREFTR